MMLSSIYIPPVGISLAGDSLLSSGNIKIKSSNSVFVFPIFFQTQPTIKMNAANDVSDAVAAGRKRQRDEAQDLDHAQRRTKRYRVAAPASGANLVPVAPRSGSPSAAAVLPAATTSAAPAPAPVPETAASLLAAAVAARTQADDDAAVVDEMIARARAAKNPAVESDERAQELEKKAEEKAKEEARAVLGLNKSWFGLW
ncbi:hypothetical protein N0V93_005178 [Gnomoniopsis smithogilvyi]|uniref:Uncharacterized protein n=1 Tax=Gnomoniopsis smithogilvyi TaxID=1191159 RepID=A0A9W8YU29_9PEZI|nr:hypothetical protein N0V93_005178 [Gnomoniopsis smithogilvyi]